MSNVVVVENKDDFQNEVINTEVLYWLIFGRNGVAPVNS